MWKLISLVTPTMGVSMKSRTVDRPQACANGVPDDVEVEVMFVQDFSDHFLSWNVGLASEIAGAFYNVAPEFGENKARFSFVRTVDKKNIFNDGPCDDEVTKGFVTDPESPIVNKFIQSSNFVKAETRPDIFGPVIRQINDWAGQEEYNIKTEARTVRIIMALTNQCPRIQDRYYGLPDGKEDLFAHDRGLLFPLDGYPMRHCNDRDYPSIPEIGTEAGNNNVILKWFVESSEERCRNADKYPEYEYAQSGVVEWWKSTNEIMQYYGANSDVFYVGESLDGFYEEIVNTILEAVCN